MKAFGLQTFIWQNNLKSILLLIIFPFIITFLGMIFVYAFNVMAYDEPDPRYHINYPLEPVVVEEEETPLEKTISSFPIISPFFFGGVGLWFLIAWASHKSMISRMTHANPIDRKSAPKLYNIVENLCISRGLPIPDIYIIEDSSLNAFSSGLSPKNSFIAFSRGIMERLTDEELQAVAAHELTHIINRDIRLMVISIIFVGIIQTLSEVFLRMRIKTKSRGKKSGSAALIILGLKLVAFILGFIVSLIVQAAISRKREFLADAGSVELTKTSQPLISALQKIAQDPMIEAIQNRSVAQMFVENPLSAHQRGIMTKLFATHPPLEERIKALQMIG